MCRNLCTDLHRDQYTLFLQENLKYVTRVRLSKPSHFPLKRQFFANNYIRVQKWLIAKKFFLRLKPRNQCLNNKISMLNFMFRMVPGDLYWFSYFQIRLLTTFFNSQVLYQNIFLWCTCMMAKLLKNDDYNTFVLSVQLCLDLFLYTLRLPLF